MHMDRTALDLPVAPKTLAKPREGLLAGQLALYIGIVLLAAFASYAYLVTTRSIFACKGRGYSATRYLAYCGGPSYADYEHGALFFNLEPPALDHAREADVLVLGNSRIQVALSNDAADDWFKRASAQYYLLGFSYDEDMVFTEELLRRMNPRASVYIINVDDFFARRETPFARIILHDPDAQGRYEWKRFWQYFHRPICGAFPMLLLCGRQSAIFRSRETGAYYRIPYHEVALPQNAVSYDSWVDDAVVKDSAALAIDFLKRFAQGKCVILTNVPYPETKIGNAEAIASGAGLPLVVPPKMDGLYTFDGFHLDRASADRWSRAFLEAAGPQIRSCLEKQGAERS
jgi:hypothetical protein